METRFDAIVIGAGPAGSSAAILLAEAGWRVALVEKQAYPRRKVCGECISATNLPLLEALGIGNAIEPLAGGALRQVALVCGARIVRAPLPPYGDPIHPWGLAIGREHLDTLLLEQARYRGVSIFQPWQVCSIAGTPGNFHCRLRQADGGEERLLPVSLVIDAHGSWEPPVPQDGRPDAPRCSRHRSSDLFAFKANFANAALEAGLLPVFSFPGGYGGMVIGGGASATFAFCIRRDALTRARSRFPGMKPAEAAHGWVRQHCSAAARLFGDAVQLGKWLGAGPIRPGIHLGGRYDGLFRIGNAAGEAHPIIGEGISMALQSAVLLAGTLVGDGLPRADGQAQARLHAEYVQGWRRHFARRIRLAALYAQLAMRPHIVSGGLPALERNPALLTRFARWSGKVRPGPGIARNGRATEYA
ncbi:MAG: dependent oxidoreductase [Massilia sp.]|nr:dependent oxidoreductase [Massilia sp.]